MPSFELIVIDFSIYRWISSDYNTLISDKISKSFRLVHFPPPNNCIVCHSFANSNIVPNDA